MEDILIQANDVQPESLDEQCFPVVNLQILPSTITSFIGPDLGGKSDWLKTLAGMNSLAKGELFLLGRSLDQMTRADWLASRKKIAFVGQDSSLLSAASLLENIKLPALYHKIGSSDEIDKNVNLLLDEIGFYDVEALNQLPAYVTQSQCYCAMLVRAFILKPKVVFIDNLFSQLDADVLHRVRRFLQNKVKNENVAIVINTRDMNYALNSSNVILFANRSGVTAFNDKAAFLESPVQEIKDYIQQNQANG